MNHKIAFLTEMGFSGKIREDHENMRTEFAWMSALNADHYPISLFYKVENYDHVFLIIPKGEVYLNAVGSRLVDKTNSINELLKSNFHKCLKEKNKKIHFVQEGPHWLFNDYEIIDQINFYNIISECDTIFAHNEIDVKYYSGMFPNKPIHVMPTLMIETLIEDIKPNKTDLAIIGGNFSRWYGGFESYTVAQEFGVPIWAQDSHSKREYEDQLDNLNHFPRLMWNQWMQELSKFKYAVHLMPTVAAGTFSLNCAYFAIPCIGNKKVDTQRLCHPELSVDVHDIELARKLAKKLKEDSDFYKECSLNAELYYNQHYHKNIWLNYMNEILS
tara:strand:- start:14178 stop:15167 length:990 start_codon:yes stop_codon:yes gene_type:complete